MAETYYVYMIQCANGSFYTGSTSDIERRFAEHCSGKRGARFTRAFKAEKLVACWSVPEGRSAAVRIECFVKKQKRQCKEKFVVAPALLAERVEAELEVSCSAVDKKIIYDAASV
jgi:putative endonuclease